MKKGFKKQLSKQNSHLMNVLIGSVIIYFLMYSINKVDKVEAVQISYREANLISMNGIKELVTKNSYICESLTTFLERQQKSIESQEKKLDRISLDMRDVVTTVAITMDKLDNYSQTQIIRIEENETN